jgi:hypothetical protein
LANTNKDRQRHVSLGVEPLSPDKATVGVLLGWGESDPVGLVPVDEARTLACTWAEENPDLAARLREVADAVDAFLASPQGSLGAVPASPKFTGAHALKEWVARYHKHFQAAYRQAGGGYAVVLATPGTESLDDPPPDFRHLGPAAADAFLAAVRMSPVGPPDACCFHLIASRQEGRFRGTFVGMLPVPEAGADLPAVEVAPVPMVTLHDRPSDN